ncbi:VOC family protein [Deinococcus oregonensis]|uniref:VOC family protein n=1 Tax=Deinococcus oregonensis TaxID=1805970 RepID=A0ABV6AZG8_9DEIO
MPTYTSHPAGTLTWLDLSSPHLEADIHFYKQVFGWDISEGAPEYGGYRMASLDGKRVAGLAPQMPGMGGGAGTWTVYVASNNAQADVQRIRDLGGMVMVEPMQVGEQGQMAVAADPTGAVFGLWQEGTHTGMELMGEHGSLCWAQVNSRDLERARQFYTEFLGATSRPSPSIPYHTLHHGPDWTAGVMQMDDANFPAEQPPHWVVYFAVDSADAAAQAAVASGGQVLFPPSDTPWGRLVVLQDPGGAVFNVIEGQQLGA